MSGVGTAIAIGTVAAAGIGAGTAIYSSNKQADAAKSAAKVQQTDQQAALAEQQREFDTTQKNQAPFLSAGTQAVNSLKALTSTPGKGLLSTYNNPFVAPSPNDVASEPGYQFTEQQGLDAINKEAAATGNVFSGSTLTAANKFGTGLAETTYNDAYNRALQTWMTNYNLWNNNQTNQFNRLSSLAGEGQVSANDLAMTGQQAANNTANIDLTSGRNIATEMNNAAAAEASGYVGAGNAISGGVNSLAQYKLLSNLLNSSNGTNAFSQVPTLPSIGDPNYLSGPVATSNDALDYGAYV